MAKKDLEVQITLKLEDILQDIIKALEKVSNDLPTPQNYEGSVNEKIAKVHDFLVWYQIKLFGDEKDTWVENCPYPPSIS